MTTQIHVLHLKAEKFVSDMNIQIFLCSAQLLIVLNQLYTINIFHNSWTLRYYCLIEFLNSYTVYLKLTKKYLGKPFRVFFLSHVINGRRVRGRIMLVDIRFKIHNTLNQSFSVADFVNYNPDDLMKGTARLNWGKIELNTISWFVLKRSKTSRRTKAFSYTYISKPGDVWLLL